MYIPEVPLPTCMFSASLPLITKNTLVVTVDLEIEHLYHPLSNASILAVVLPPTVPTVPEDKLNQAP
jgi:hypothetical protein